MTKAEDKKIQALARKNAAMIVKPKDGVAPPMTILSGSRRKRKRTPAVSSRR
jgi:hypothetical protein